MDTSEELISKLRSIRDAYEERYNEVQTNYGAQVRTLREDCQLALIDAVAAARKDGQTIPGDVLQRMQSMVSALKNELNG